MHSTILSHCHRFLIKSEDQFFSANFYKNINNDCLGCVHLSQKFLQDYGFYEFWVYLWRVSEAKKKFFSVAVCIPSLCKMSEAKVTYNNCNINRISIPQFAFFNGTLS